MSPRKAAPKKTKRSKTVRAVKTTKTSKKSSSGKKQKTSAVKGGKKIEEAVDLKVSATTKKVGLEKKEKKHRKEIEAASAAPKVEPKKKGSGLVRGDFSPTNTKRDQLILEYAPLIKYIAQRIAARLPANIELDDLISSGVIGLMDAIEKYDSSRDNKFKTYAEFRIRGAILDELRAQDWVPRSVREKAKQLERCYSKIEQEKGRQATDEEVCAALGINKEEFHELLNQVRSVSLLSFEDFSNFSKADKRAVHLSSESSHKASTPFSEVNSASLKEMIAKSIQDLPEKQRLVLSLYYYEDLNLKEIGRILDVTESRVSQLHTQAVIRLKAKLRNHWDEFATIIN